MDRYSNEKDIEICAVKLHISCTIIIVTVYRSPTGNIDYFLNNLEEALNHIYNNTVDIILCGDFNINCLNDNQDKQALNPVLTSYSLYSIIDFPTRIYNNSQTMIDNIFINKFKNENYSVSPRSTAYPTMMLKFLAYSILLLQMILMNFIRIEKLINTH